jgi:hypothetical protein
MPSLLGKLDGPPQGGQGSNGQYVYWICMVFPTEQTVAEHSVKTPADFDRETFRQVVAEAHAFCNVELVETVCFKEPHADGRPHFNLLVRAKTQYRWLKVAQRMLRFHKVFVGFGQNINSWAQGVVYGCVASDHKLPEGLDHEYTQWHVADTPTPLKQFLPKRWQEEGFVRHPRLTNIAFYDLCTTHEFKDYTAVWGKALQLDETGDRGLLAYLLDNDGQAAFAKVLQARGAKETLRRATLTREQLLEEFVSTQTCCCPSDGFCHGLMKEILQKNNLDGVFQKEVLGAMRSGRLKQRNLCLLGSPDCGKSFLLKGLLGLFRVYERPEGGSSQLEDLLGSEVVFLNDFEYDAEAPKWMPWSYLKNFLEGSAVKVAVPKNRGGNQVFKGTAPVFLTAPAEVVLKRYNKEVQTETEQMRKRIKYLTVTHQIPAEQRKEVLAVCPHCSARLYLEGKELLDNPAAQPLADLASVHHTTSEERAAKRQRTAADCVQELLGLKSLFEAGVLSVAELEDLKAKLLRGD